VKITLIIPDEMDLWLFPNVELSVWMFNTTLERRLPRMYSTGKVLARVIIKSE